ncbi:MAG: substrate-binding domain-containing protein [Desulfobacterales bacterium]
MKRMKLVALGITTAFLLACTMVPAKPVTAEEGLRYSSSAQVHSVFQDEVLEAFTRETGVKVDLFVGSSSTAMNRLFNDVCDVASTAEPLYRTHQDYGYVETPFCRVPLVVIAHAQVPVRDLSETQLREVFSGQIANWKELGGPDRDIVVVAPGKGTAAYKNFSQLALKRHEVDYDFMTERSTMVVDAVKHIPYSISFIAMSAAVRDAAVKTIKVNGTAPSDKFYPYIQEFNFVTRGAPSGAAKTFIDYARSEPVKAKLKANGITPADE